MTMQKDLPYLVKEAFNVPQSTILTVQPGTVIKFSDSSLNIDGTLNAVGTDSQQIVFTSVDDDTYGGDIRSSNDTSPVEPGQWSGIHFNSDSINSDLENIIVRYGGGSLGGNFGAAVKVDQSSVELKNSIIQDNAQNGFLLVNSPSVIDSVQFLDNKAVNGGNSASGVNIQEGSPEVKNSHFDDNDYGIYINDTGNPSTPNLHNIDPADPMQNTFGTNIIKDIYDNNPQPPPVSP